MNHIRILLSVLLIFILHATATSDPAASAKSAATSPKNTDAWKTWKKGCDIYERGESLMLAGKYEEAQARFTEALKYFNIVKEEKPQWSRKIIDSRIQLCQRKIENMGKYQAMTPEERKKEGIPGETASPQTQTTGGSNTTEVENLKKEIERVNTELQKYKDKLFAAVVEIENAQRDIEREKRRTEQAHKAEAQIEGLLKEKNELEKNYILLNTAFETLKKQKSGQTPSEKDNSAEILAAEKQKYIQLAALCESLKKEAAEYKERFGKAAAERTLLTETAKRNEAESQKLINALKSAEEKVKDAQKTAEKSTADLLGMDKEFKKVSAKNKELATELEKLNADLAKLRSSPNSDSIVSQLNLENEKLKNDKAALQEKIESIFNEKNKLSAEIAKKTSELEKTSNILAAIEQERKKLKDKAEKSSTELEEKKNILSQTSAHLKTIEEENKNYKEKAEKLASEYNELRSKVDAGSNAEKKESAILGKELETLKSDIQNKSEALKKAVEEKNNAEKVVATLNQKVADLNQKIEDSLKKASNDSELKNLIAEKDSALKKAVADKDSTEKTIVALNQKVAELNQKIEDSLKKASNDSELKNLIAEKDNTLKKMLVEKNNSDKTIADLNQKVTELNQKLAKAIIDNSSAVKTAQAAQNAEKIQKLNSEIAKLSAENQKEKENAAAREKAIAASLDSAKKELVKKEQETAEILKKLQKIKQDISTASKQDSKEKQELSTTLTELKQMNAKLEKELADAKTDMVSRSELQQKDKAMSALIEELKRSRETNNTLKLQMEEIKKSRETKAKPEAGPQETATQKKEENNLAGSKILPGDKLGVERNSAAPASAKGDNEKISYLVKTGLESENQGDLKTALWHYKKALQIEPDNLKALTNTARAAFKLKDFQLAGESARQALKKRSSDADLMRIYAASSWKNGELEDASKTAEQLTKLSQNQADDYLLFAEISFQLKKFPAAEQAYKKTLELDPTCGKAAMGLAKIYSSDKTKLTEGMKYYRKALKLKEKAEPELEEIYPKEPEAKNEQARIMIIRKDSGETFFICDKILYGASNPPPPAAVSEKKKELTVDLSTVPKADRPELDKAIYDFFINSAEAAEKKNEWTVAAWNYKKAALFQKTSPDPLLKAAAILREKLKMYGKALEIYEQVLEEFKDEPRALTELGIMYYEQGKYEKALERLNTAVLIEPNNATIQRYQGLICLKLGNKNAAEKMLLKAFKTDPKNADIALDLAKLYTLTFKTRLSDGAKWYRTAKMLGAAPDKVLEGFFTTNNKKKAEGK